VYLKYAPFGGDGHDATFTAGRAGDTYLAGDFDGNGTASVGFVRGNAWQLPGIPAFTYGSAGMRWVVGDWDADGTDTPGAISRTNEWSLRDASSTGPARTRFVFDT